ncbi:hypothetical protein KUTeg_000083 [Tegillarca granosa]|uniref:Uncharacterized protein n=1 Tax=Tegillarca granosa TaxID=220873 RepID=A0ABQ9FZZ8_TEGGR|nr:hypothetical protein KUTeg_000083 [Tegillarca granosa]
MAMHYFVVYITITVAGFYYFCQATARRFNGFRLYIGTSENWFDEDQCYNDTEDGYPPSVLTVVPSVSMGYNKMIVLAKELILY